MLPHETTAWAELDALARSGTPDILHLLHTEPQRLVRLSQAVCGIRFDFSKLPLDGGQLDALLQLAAAADLAGWRARLQAGEVVNPSERQAATHMQLRAPGNAAAATVIDLAAQVRNGALGAIRDVIHIGMGGSVLGPELLCDALDAEADGPRVHFVGNVDATALARALRACDPAHTLIIAVSKTFRTAETRVNLRSAIDWLRAGGIARPAQRVIAVTAEPAAARALGEVRLLDFGHAIGGRYSLWSAVGLSFAIRNGGAAFAALLAGAQQMDAHFCTAPAARNLPVLAALTDVWQACFLGRPTRAVFAYDERLRLLPPYLQQLEMESNGKSVARDGTPLPFPTAPIVWGGVGTCAQHSVFQLLHQGSHTDPVEFVTVATPAHDFDPAHHQTLLANCLAQAAALLRGRSSAEALALAGNDAALARALEFPGNRGSAVIILDELTPARLGALLAFYEARTISAGILMGINSFDQWGVELGKTMAAQLVEGRLSDADPSTLALWQQLGLQTGSPSPDNAADSAAAV